VVTFLTAVRFSTFVSYQLILLFECHLVEDYPIEKILSVDIMVKITIVMMANFD